MIRKPTSPLPRESAAIATTRKVAVAGQSAVRAGGHSVRGLVCFAFAGIWGFAALAAGAAGSLPTFVGVGIMALGAGWGGMRAFRKAAAAVQAAPSGSSSDVTDPAARPVLDGAAPTFGRRHQAAAEPSVTATARFPMVLLSSLAKRLLLLAGMALLVFG